MTPNARKKSNKEMVCSSDLKYLKKNAASKMTQLLGDYDKPPRYELLAQLATV